MDFAEEFLHIFVADSEVMFLLCQHLLVLDLVLLFATDPIPASLPALFGVILVLFAEFVVVECVLALGLRAELTLCLCHVVTPDEQANEHVEETVDRDE